MQPGRLLEQFKTRAGHVRRRIEAAQGPPSIRVPYTAHLPLLDASPANSAWHSAATIAALTLSEGPEAAGLAPVPTQIKLLWSEEALAVRFVCPDDSLYLPEHGRDAPIWKGDVVEVFLDAKGDGRQWIELEVNADNDQFDLLATLTAPPQVEANGRLTREIIDRDWWTNVSWNLEAWRTAASRTDDGWIVDMAIPAAALKRLGMNAFAPITLRANFLRYKYLPEPDGSRRLLAMNWAPVAYGCPHISPKRMGYLRLETPFPRSFQSGRRHPS